MEVGDVTEPAADSGNTSVFPSIDDVEPDEEGGPAARAGFNYQDEIAVGFLIEMLENPSLIKVHCETHDDILLIRTMDGSTTLLVEFVQVKANESDKLWSVADLCAPKKKGKTNLSIFETSLQRDKYCEQSRFRLVTLRPVVKKLRILTLPFLAPGREPNGERFKRLQLQLEKRFPGLKSPKGNGAAYWLENCFWDQRHSEDAVQDQNFVRIIQLSHNEGRLLLPEYAKALLDELRNWAKKAGRAKWVPDRERKIITRPIIREWWERRTRELIEGRTAPSGGQLRRKMIEAGLPNELIGLAVEMRRDYASVARTSRYMEPDEREDLQRRVKSEVMSLGASFFAGHLDLDGTEFHALCVSRMDEVNAARPANSDDRSAFLKGCMYDIADRCFLQFARPPDEVS